MQFPQKYNLVIKTIIIMLVPTLYAQNIYHDPKISWDTIKSKHFNIHVPTEHIKLGVEIADICERVYPIVSNSLDYYPNLTHVVIHTENDESSGFTSHLPWRMELFVTPPQANITGKNITWLESLILHEFTHIVHLRKHKGLSSLTRPFLGEFNTVWQMITPTWFTEGIATLNETRFGNGGRGRNAHFWMQMAEPILNNNHWKLNNTNYYSRKKLPTSLMPYISGYYIMDNVNQNFGEYAWGRILNRYSSYPMFGFKNAIKAVTGLNVNFVYNEVINGFEDQRNLNRINKEYKVWHDSELIVGQYSPRWLDNNNILFYQKGIDKPQKLVKVNRVGDVEELLNRKLSNIDNSFAYKDSIIYTTEHHIATRYSGTKYADLHSYNIRSNKNKRLTIKKRLYSIDISQNNAELIGVQTFLPNNRLSIIDSKNGEILKYIDFNNNIVLNPRWSPSGNKIAIALEDSVGTVNIAVYDLKSNKWRYIYEPNINQDNQPCWSQDEKYIYFSSDQSGVFNIWVVNVQNGERWMITDEELGAFTPDVSPSGREIAFSVYTKNGFRVVTQNLDISTWINGDKIYNENKLLYSRGKIIFNEIINNEDQQYSIAKYSPLSQIIKPQGWIPYLYEDEEGRGIAAYLRAEDALHRHMWYGSIGLSLNQKDPVFDLSYIYSKYWPKVNLKAYSLLRKMNSNDETAWWRENGFEFGVIAPIILENNIYNTSSILSMQFIQNQLKKSKGIIEPDQRIYRGIEYGFQLNRSSYTFKNITPYFAWFFNSKIEVSDSLLYSDYNSGRLSAELDLFIPSLGGSNLELYFGYLSRYGDYEYQNDFVPIGFSTNNSDKQIRILTSYYQPLSFLEWQIPIIPIFVEYVYLKPFFDYSIGYFSTSSKSEINTINSMGVGLSARNIIFYRYKFEIGINIYKKSINNNIEYNPFIRINL